MNGCCNLAVAAASLSLGLTSITSAEIGDPVVATGGEVVITIEGGTAGYTNDLFYMSGTGPIRIGSNRDFGLTMSLGIFSAGTELVFAMRVLDTGHEFFTGPASRNFDGVAHSRIMVFDGYSRIGMEDIFGGGDFDLDDLSFTATNVVPGPGAMALGLVAAAFSGRHRRR
jgi:MYXO-CTERM domain-containing protein